MFEEYLSSIPKWKQYFPILKFESEKIEEVVNAFNEIINVYGFSEASYEAMLRIGIINFYLQNDKKVQKDF